MPRITVAGCACSAIASSEENSADDGALDLPPGPVLHRPRERPGWYPGPVRNPAQDFQERSESVQIKALSVRQPWANAIMLGKDVENRSRYFAHRGLLLIHASSHLDYRARRDPRIKAL